MVEIVPKPGCEWGFDVPSDQVNLERIVRELDGVVAMYAYSYIGELKANAPLVYRRLRDWAIANKRLIWVGWDFTV